MKNRSSLRDAFIVVQPFLLPDKVDLSEKEGERFLELEHQLTGGEFNAAYKIAFKLLNELCPRLPEDLQEDAGGDLWRNILTPIEGVIRIRAYRQILAEREGGRGHED